MQEILLSDLPARVKNKGAVSERARRDRWQAVAYRTAEVSGRMLLAGEEMFPEAVELELGASGWHRIYVCRTQNASTATGRGQVTNGRKNRCM